MARYTGPKCKLCRREGAKLFLKGARCESDKCAFSRRQSAPGVHGSAFKRKTGDFGIQLREKQKVKRIYGVLEKQFRNYFEVASKKAGVTGEYLLGLLERRLDNVVYRANFASSRAQARKLVGAGKFNVNGKNSKTPSILLGKDDVITTSLGAVSEKDIPAWILVEKGGIKVLDMPSREDIKENINEKLIVEFYSR